MDIEEIRERSLDYAKGSLYGNNGKPVGTKIKPARNKRAKRRKLFLERKSGRKSKHKRSRLSRKYLKYMDSERWKAFRELIFAQRGRFCERCSTTQRLQVHHKTYDRLGHEDPWDVEILCFSCHRIEHPGKKFT